MEFEWGSRTFVMGIINVTPDSFSGDGVLDPTTAVAQGYEMESAGADILDVGGMSSRPGHAEISAAEELERVMAVLPRLRNAVGVAISIDTYRYQVAEAAVEAGASMINDIWGLKREPRLAELAAARGCGLVLMHNQEGTEYTDLVAEVIDSLRRSIEVAESAGVQREALIVVDDRLEGTAATVALGIAAGADIVRVHDVEPMVRVARMTDAIVRGGWKEPEVAA